MAGPRFKLDLVAFDDLATLLPLPVSVEPSRVTLQQHGSAELDMEMSKDLQLLEQLNAVLTRTDISYVHPVCNDVASTLNPSSRLAKSLVDRNPILFQYGVSEVDTADATVATPGRSSAMAVAAHNSQPDVLTNPSHCKERPVTASAAGERKRARRGPKHEVYVMNSHEAEAAAAKLKSFLESSIAAASRIASDGASDDDDAHASMEEEDDQVPGRGHRHARSSHVFRLETLKDLHGKLLTAQSQGYLRLVPSEQLHTLLLALSSAAGAGRNQLIMEDAEVKSGPVARVIAALEAMLCELVVLSTPNLPASLYLEELLTCAVELTKYHLQYNVLALHDARFKRMYRPGSMEDDRDEPVKSAKTPRGRGARAAAAGNHLPRWSTLLVGQLEQSLSLLASVVGLVRVATEGLIPLVRMSQQALTVDSLQTLHYRALGLAVSMFKYYPQQRSTVMDEFVQGVLSHLNPGKHVARHFPLQSTDKATSVQMATALVMQLVQVAAELPPVDAGGAAALGCVNSSTRWSDYFWQEILKKLPSARAAKADSSMDFKAWVEALVEDLLAALPLPEWPAAAVLLRRLILAINGDLGMRSADSGARLACVDLLGLLTRRLCGLAKEADEPEAARAVTTMVDAAMASAGDEAGEIASNKAEVVQQLLLEHLADAGSGASSVAAAAANGGCGSSGGPGTTSVAGSARQLVTCTMLSAHVKALRQHQGEDLDEQQANEAIVRYRQIYERQRSCLGTSTSGLPDVARDGAVTLCRWLVADSVLGRSRSTLLRWLADAGGGGRTRQDAHAAAVRAKAIKLLGGAIEADVRVLSMADVQDGIKGALGDESVLVREAAVDLIGKHISRSTDLAVQYYDILVRASEDVGVTVRKRAIRLLWECCVRCADFRHRSDALLRIVSRATDTEETMRTLVTKICSEIWFLPHFQIEDELGISHVTRGPVQRAAQLGEVVMTMYSRMGSAANVPFHSAMPIVVTVRSIVGEEGKSEHEAVRQGAKEVADALLARALELQAEQDQAAAGPGPSGRQDGPAPAEELFQCLLALHVLCVADVRLLHRPADPQRVVRSLAPYIKEMPLAASDLASRRKAEQLLVVLAVLGGCMAGLRHMDDTLAAEIVQDLRSIIIKGFHVQAVTVACQCLCTLATLKPQHRKTVREQATMYYNQLEADYLKKATSSPDRQRLYPRFLYTIGTLCRYGADILDDTSEAGKHPSCATTLDLVLRYYTLLTDNLRARDTALQALGSIFIARPHLAVDVREVQPVLEGALERTAPASLKSRCLTSLTELLRVEEDVLVARQAAARQEVAAAQQASTLPEAESRALARRNGEGDTGSVSSGLIQMLWERILALATDTTPASSAPSTGGQTPPPTPSGTAAAHGAVVRRRALELIEVVIRGGIVVPWSAMPALCALATDPERDTASRALSCLRSIVAANTAFVAGQVPSGVTEAYLFHCKLAAVDRPGEPPAPDQCRPLLEGLSSVWNSVFQPDRALKSKFLTALLKPLDDGCCLASGSAAKSDPHLLSFLAYVIAELPYRKMDELLAVLARLNEILSRRAEAVLARFQELRQAGRPPKDVNGAAAGPSGSVNVAPSASPLPSRGSANPAASSLAATVKASLAVSLMMLLKQYLRMSYDLTAERVAKYDPGGPQRKVEEKLNAVHNGKLRFNASKLRVDVAARMQGQPLAAHQCAPGGSAKAARAAAALASAGGGAVVVSVQDPGVDEVYKVLKTLMKQDELDYRHAAPAAGGEGDIHHESPANGDLGGVSINLAEIMAAPDGATTAKKPPLASRGRGRGGRGRGSRGGGAAREGGSGRGGRGRPPSTGVRSGATTTKRGGKRKRGRSDSDESDNDGSDDAGNEDYRPPTTKRRLDRAL